MITERKDIIITVVFEEETHILTTYQNEYRSLMHLIFDRIYIENFGDCKGMGRCGTCLIEMLNHEHSIAHFDRNELTTLKRLGEIIPNTRLSCQILIDARIDQLHCRVLLPENTGY